LIKEDEVKKLGKRMKRRKERFAKISLARFLMFKSTLKYLFRKKYPSDNIRMLAIRYAKERPKDENLGVRRNVKDTKTRAQKTQMFLLRFVFLIAYRLETKMLERPEINDARLSIGTRPIEFRYSVLSLKSLIINSG
jgi:hypothetical protein